MPVGEEYVDSQRLETIITNYEQRTHLLRDLQKQAFWASWAQVFFVLADDVLFFVRRSPTIWAFDPVYIAAAVIGILGARKMITIYMLSHLVLNVAVTGIILLYAVLQALFGYDTQRDIVVMFAIRIPLLAAVSCGVPSYRLYKAVKSFRRSGIGQDQSNSMLETAVGSTATTQDGSEPSVSRREAQQAGAAALARARSDAGLPRPPSNELPGIQPEYLCPIMCTVMRDPHMTEVGNTYERESIQRCVMPTIAKLGRLAHKASDGHTGERAGSSSRSRRKRLLG